MSVIKILERILFPPPKKYFMFHHRKKDFGTTWQQVNDNNIFIFGVIPLISPLFCCNSDMDTQPAEHYTGLCCSVCNI